MIITIKLTVLFPNCVFINTPLLYFFVITSAKVAIFQTLFAVNSKKDPHRQLKLFYHYFDMKKSNLTKMLLILL